VETRVDKDEGPGLVELSLVAFRVYEVPRRVGAGRSLEVDVWFL